MTSEVRKSLHKGVRRLKSAAVTASRSARADKGDKATLRDAKELLSRSVDNLIRIIDQHDALIAVGSDLPPDTKARLVGRLGNLVVGGDADLRGLLWAASAIGSLALDTPLARRELNTERTTAASNAKRAASLKRDQVLLELVAQVRSEHSGWSDWRIANTIKEQAKEKLGLKTATSVYKLIRLNLKNR